MDAELHNNRLLAQIHDRLDEQSKSMKYLVASMAQILEALTPDGCGHENWEEVTTSGAPHRTYVCAEPGCTEQKTEPWD